MVKLWLHKRYWRKKPFRQHHWSEWGKASTITLSNPKTGKATRSWSWQKRSCPCGAWQHRKLWQRTYYENGGTLTWSNPDVTL